MSHERYMTTASSHERGGPTALQGARIRRVLITYPRSGTHWLKVLIEDAMGAEALRRRLIEPAEAIDAVEHESTERLVYEHFDFDMHGAILDPASYPGLRMVLLYRNPLDVLISQFHRFAADGQLPDNGLSALENLKLYLHQSRSDAPFPDAGRIDWPLPESLREGVRSRIVDWVRSGRCLEVRYEELVADTARELARVLDYLDIDYTATGLAEIVERNRFERRSGGRPPGVEDPASHHRKGVPGEWRAVYDADDLRIIDATIGDYLDFLGYRLDEQCLTTSSR